MSHLKHTATRHRWFEHPGRPKPILNGERPRTMYPPKMSTTRLPEAPGPREGHEDQDQDHHSSPQTTEGAARIPLTLGGGDPEDHRDEPDAGRRNDVHVRRREVDGV